MLNILKRIGKQKVKYHTKDKTHTIKLRFSKNIFKIIRVKDDPFGIDINIINLILHPRFFLTNLGMAKAD